MPTSTIYPIEKVHSWLSSKTYGVLGTISPDGYPHSTSVLYGTDPDAFVIYIVTGINYRKKKNIELNNKVSFVVPFPHHIMRFVPSNCIQFQGMAEILPASDPKGQSIFNSKRILRMSLNDAIEKNEQFVFLRITPTHTIHGYGLGRSMFDLRKHHTEGGFKAVIL